MRNRALALVTALVLLASTVAGPVALVSAQTAAAPSGFVGVPDANIGSPLPSQTPMGQTAQEIEAAGVMASSNASSLEVIVTNPGRAKKFTDGAVLGDGPIAIVLRDDVHDAGRTVALPAGPLKDVLGYVPKMAYGTHEDGSTWSTENKRQGDWLLVEIPHFSTNTVTFEGEFQATGTYQDGSSFQYDVNDLDAASDVSVKMTGVLNTEVDIATGSGVGVDHTKSISTAGNGAINGTGDATLSVTAHEPRVVHSIINDEGDGTTEGSSEVIGDSATDARIKKEIEFTPSTGGKVQNVTLHIATNNLDYSPNVDIYIAQGDTDHSATDGTLVKDNWSPPTGSTGGYTVSLGSNYSVSAGTTYTVQFKTMSSDGDGNWDTLELGYDNSPSEIVIATGYSSWTDTDSYLDLDVGINSNVTSLSVKDGAGHSHNFSSWSDGETQTVSFPLTTSSTELNFSGAGSGTIDYTLTYKERTITQDPGVELNDGHWANFSGTLSDGEKTSLTINKSALQTGTNTVNVSMPSLSADAPPMQVYLNYSHGSQDQMSVSYEAEKFTERYNVSKTYASDRQSATLTIPFQGAVVGLRDLTVTKGGSTISPTTSWNETTLTVDLGSVAAGESVEVVANGSKVSTWNGKIQVLEPTAIGSALDSKISVTSYDGSGDVQLGVGGLPTGDKIHYTYSESWDAPKEYAYVTDDGSQFLTLPNAAAGSTFRATTLPVTVSTTGDVAIEVIEADQSPTLKISEANGANDEVTLSYLLANKGEEWIVYSETLGHQVASDTANSPVTFTIDDDVGIIEIRESTTDGSTADSTDETNVIRAVSHRAQQPVGLFGLIAVPLGGLALLVGIAGLALVWYGRRRDNPSAAVSAATREGAQVFAGVINTATAYPRVSGALVAMLGIAGLATGAISLGSQVGTIVVASALLVGGFVVLQEIGYFDWKIYALVAGLVALWALSTVSPATLQFVFEGLKPVIPLFGIAGIYLFYKAIQAWRAPEKTVNLNIVAGRDNN